MGFDPEDEIYQAGMQFHASKTWERKNGKRIYALIFGPRYKDCAEAICEALNSGAGLDEVIAIADNTTEQNAQERAEKKAEYFAKKAERAERAAVLLRLKYFSLDRFLHLIRNFKLLCDAFVFRCSSG